MLCSRMIANQNPAWTTALDLTSPFFFDASRTANHNPRVFCHLRTLFALVSHEIARNSSRINHLRTLSKTTGGGVALKTGSVVQALLSISTTLLCFQRLGPSCQALNFQRSTVNSLLPSSGRNDGSLSHAAHPRLPYATGSRKPCPADALRRKRARAARLGEHARRKNACRVSRVVSRSAGSLA